ncbi:hypothetical protein Hanom_Chr15g01371391 [Helianthus anomalus]
MLHIREANTSAIGSRLRITLQATKHTSFMTQEFHENALRRQLYFQTFNREQA